MVARLEGTPAGRFALRLIELRVVDRALALSSKLFVAIPAARRLSSSILSKDSFGDELADRFGLTGAGANAARVHFASPTQVWSSLGLLELLILVSSVLSFAPERCGAVSRGWRAHASTSR